MDASTNLNKLEAAAFEATSEGILICLSSGEIVKANTACHRIFGYENGTLTGQNVSLLLPDGLKSHHGNLIQAFFQNPSPRPMGLGRKLLGKQRGGDTFPIEISLNFLDVAEQPMAMAFIADVSNKKAQEQELVDYHKAIDSKDKALQDSLGRYNSVLATAVDGIIVIDERGIIDLVNPAVETLFGYQSAELKGKRINTLMPSPYEEEHDSYMSRYQNTGEKRIIGIGREVQGKKKDGSIFPFHLSVSEVQLNGKKLYTGVIHDLTQQKAYENQLKEYSEHLEQKVRERTHDLEELNTFLEEQMEALMQAQDAVKRSENMYKLIARNFPNGTINVFDKELRYVFVEGKELFELGITSEKLIGTKFLDRLDPQLVEVAERELMQVFDGQPRVFEIDFQDNHYVLNAVPLTDTEYPDEVRQILVVERNITRQKKAEEDIRNALEKERMLGELKTRFVTMASHEFRTPLSTIASSATLISKYTNTEQQPKRDKHINRIHSNVKHLTGILNDFLSLGKLEEGLVENLPDHFNISEFLQELTEEMEPSLKEKQSVQYEHQGEKVVFLDPKLLRNVMLNLFSNAIKYSHENAVITLETAVLDSGIAITVKDQGIGIPQEDLEHLFTRFFRATNTGNIQGTGMGLNIVKKYIDLMNGSITVESQLNIGTTFTIYFDRE